MSGIYIYEDSCSSIGTSYRPPEQMFAKGCLVLTADTTVEEPWVNEEDQKATAHGFLQTIQGHSLRDLDPKSTIQRPLPQPGLALRLHASSHALSFDPYMQPTRARKYFTRPAFSLQLGRLGPYTRKRRTDIGLTPARPADARQFAEMMREQRAFLLARRQACFFNSVGSARCGERLDFCTLSVSPTAVCVADPIPQDTSILGSISYYPVRTLFSLPIPKKDHGQ